MTAGLDARREAGDARRGAAAPAAHPRPELHRPADAAARPQCELRAHRRAGRRPRVRVAVGRAGHGGARLGQGAPASASRTMVSLGERADVDFGDLLDHLASDAHTRSILLYIESIEAPRKFMSAARAAARNKPVIVVKAGRAGKGVKAAASHTGALAGSDIVFDAAIRRAGMLRVDTLQDLFMAAETLARFGGNRDDALTIMTNGGGAGVMAADAAALAGVDARAIWRGDRAPDSTRRCRRRGRTATRSTSSATRRSQRYAETPAGAARRPRRAAPCCSCMRRRRSCAATTSRAPARRSCAARAGRVMACWLGDGGRRARRGASSPRPASPTTRRPKKRCAHSRMLATYRRNQALLLRRRAAERERTAADRGRARARSTRRSPRAASCSARARPSSCSRPTASRSSRPSPCDARAEAAAAAAAASSAFRSR